MIVPHCGHLMYLDHSTVCDHVQGQKYLPHLQTDDIFWLRMHLDINMVLSGMLSDPSCACWR